jgi:hypothetical protein
MKRNLWPLLFLALLSTGVLMNPDAAAAGAGDRNGSESCVTRIRVTRAQNPFRVWDARSTRSGDSGPVVQAADLVAESFDAVPSLARYAVHGVMLMGIRKTTREPVVSVKYFTPLARVDATRIRPGQRMEIGKILDLSPSPLTLRDIILFLLESQVIATYWHVESVICLSREEEAAGVYRASFQGIHKYFTNRYNEENLAFTVSIDRKTGAIALVGGP